MKENKETSKKIINKSRKQVMKAHNSARNKELRKRTRKANKHAHTHTCNQGKQNINKQQSKVVI